MAECYAAWVKPFLRFLCTGGHWHPRELGDRDVKQVQTAATVPSARRWGIRLTHRTTHLE
jgi:hypothetical protein